MYLMRERRQKETGSTHLSPEELSCTSPASWLQWLQDAPWQPDTPWARPTCPSCWGRRGPSSRPSARWLFAGYLRRCSHLLVIGMHQAFLCNRTVIDLSIISLFYLQQTRSHILDPDARGSDCTFHTRASYLFKILLRRFIPVKAH